MQMQCMACGDQHPYVNPKQFSSWARRHRAKYHARIDGRLMFTRVTKRSKEWKSFGEKPPCNPRVMLSLPQESGDQHRIFFDRRTGIFWREDLFLAPTQWSFYSPRPRTTHRNRT